MKLAHYTTAAHLGLILRTGVLEASDHEGMVGPQNSFVTMDGEAPTFFWSTNPAPDEFSDRRKARLIVEVPDYLVLDWETNCSSNYLVGITALHEDISAWRTVAGDIPSTQFVAAEMLTDVGWVRVTLQMLEHLMAGHTFAMLNARTGGIRYAVY